MLLSPGDRVAVVAPSGPFPRADFERGLAILSARYRVDHSDALFHHRRYLAGTDSERANALRDAIIRPEPRAIFCARGGYGAARLLPLVPQLRSLHKPLVGFSDITALHAVASGGGRKTVHGPVVTQLPRLPDIDVERLFSILETHLPPAPLQATGSVGQGATEGTLIGGNLSVLASLVGTPFFPNLKGAILLIEDIGERPYRLDRLWNQLLQSRMLEGVRGVAVGDMTDCEEKGADYTSHDVLRELLAEARLPALLGLPIGHGTRNAAVILGARARMDASSLQLEHLESLATTVVGG